MNLKRVKQETEKIIAAASFNLRADVWKMLRAAQRSETNQKAKKALAWIIENAQIAKKEKLAICQDTGFPVIFLEAGKNVNVSESLVGAVKEGVEAGYRKNYLRASVTDPLVRKPAYRGSVVHIGFFNGRGLKITFFPKGFGSENKSKLKMFNPTASFKQISQFIVDAVAEAGVESCPPFIVGVGIGGTSDQALILAKKALLERIDKPNPDKKLDSLEKALVKKINSLKIGPMGFGGKTSCLSVKIKKSPTHIAGLPVGVNISCHALRSASIRL